MKLPSLLIMELPVILIDDEYATDSKQLITHLLYTLIPQEQLVHNNKIIGVNKIDKAIIQTIVDVVNEKFPNVTRKQTRTVITNLLTSLRKNC